jgi:hypothetical protein
MMKSSWLFGSVLIFCILFLTFGQCHAQQYSPEFQALLNQVQQAYLTPKGDNLSSLRNKYPTVVATLVGHALRQQMVHVQQNPSLNNQFMNLQREAGAYIGEVARTTSARFDDGSRYTPDALWSIVNRAYQGQDDGWVLQTFRVRTGTMPSVLAASPGPQPQQRPLGGLFEKQEEKNQIELLGKVAPSVKGPPKETPPPPTPPPPRQIALKPDGIQGPWTANFGRTQLRLWRQGDLYLGSMSGERHAYGYNFKPNEVCLRLKYAGEGANGPIFKGQFHGYGGIQGDYRWEDITFYYFLSNGKERFATTPNVSAMTSFERR